MYAELARGSRTRGGNNRMAREDGSKRERDTHTERDRKRGGRREEREKERDRMCLLMTHMR